ncbi:MAG: 16S rRNA (guanine(527)-N(7))-methyltransferase RsmG [Fimbriimonadaceae bacterium]
MNLEIRKELERFLDAMYTWNENVNLTRVPRSEAWVRHIEDSLLHEDLIPFGSQVLDLGTGPGLPAWPLAKFRPDLEVTALDSSGKMLEFLRSQPLKNLKVVQARAEELQTPESFDVLTGRAVAPLSMQLEISAKPLKMGGLFIPMRTPNDQGEVERLKACLGLTLQSSHERPLGEVGIRLFPVWRKTEKTPKGYPRKWALIRKQPL